jgi:hypothetical protein
MKRYLRFCLIFMISLALPLSVMAGVRAPTEPCPMKAMGMAMMDDMGMYLALLTMPVLPD